MKLLPRTESVRVRQLRQNSPTLIALKFSMKAVLRMYQAASVSRPIENPADVRTLDQLRLFVHIALCRKENLLEHHFPMSELELTQNGVRCGFQFVLHGPRSVKLAAVWAESSNEILLYDATGHRFSRIRLPHRVTG